MSIPPFPHYDGIQKRQDIMLVRTKSQGSLSWVTCTIFLYLSKPEFPYL